MSTPHAALAISYTLHMLATVSWFGALVVTGTLLLPPIRSLIPAGQFLEIFRRINRQVQSLGWVSLSLLIGTGLLQMSASPHYDGFLSIQNQWSISILLKHLAFAVILCLSGYQTWGLFPRLERAWLVQKSKGESSSEALSIVATDQTVILANLVLGILVLVFTALARTA